MIFKGENILSFGKLILRITALCLTASLYLVEVENCENTRVCETSFEKYNQEMFSCLGGQPVASGWFLCSLSCAEDPDCSGFSLDLHGNMCSICRKDELTSGFEGNEQRVYVRRRFVRNEWTPNYSNVSETLAIPGGLHTGSVVRLTGVFVNYTGFSLDLTNTANRSDISLQVRPREDFYTKVPAVVVTNRRAMTWFTNQSLRISEFPFNLDQEFDIHILVKTDAFDIFINGLYFVNYTNYSPLLKINYIIIIGSIKMIQLSY